MKKRYAFILIAFVSIVSSCDKDPIIRNAKNVGISTVAYYPNITLTGDPIIAVANGTPFTDPGVKAEAGGEDVPVVTTGTVNTDADGIYTLNYTATNADGVSTAHRTIAVYTTDADAASHDLSGKYFRAATGETSTWAKIGPGVYSVLNPAGSAVGEGLTVVVINPTGYTISIPDQAASDGSDISSDNEEYVNANPATYSWVVLNIAYATNLRSFEKQE